MIHKLGNRKLIIALVLAAIMAIAAVAWAQLAPYFMVDDATTTNCVDITGTSAQWTVPAAYRGRWFTIVSVDNTAYLKGGSNPSIASVAAGNFAFFSPDSAPIMMRLTGPKIAVIGKSAVGYICFTPQKS